MTNILRRARFPALIILGNPLGSLSPAVAQETTSRTRSVENADARVVFPMDQVVDTTNVVSALQMFSDLSRRVRLPSDLLPSDQVTIGLALGLPDGREGRAEPASRQFMIPIEAISEWPRKRLERVMAHELTHIAIGELFDYRTIPIWFDEGLAEWSSGGPDCEARARLRHYLARLEPFSREEAFDFFSRGRARLSYDLFSDFFRYIELRLEEHPAKLKQLLLQASNIGIEPAFVGTLGQDLRLLERRWTADLLERYRSESLTCVPVPSGGES